MLALIVLGADGQHYFSGGVGNWLLDQGGREEPMGEYLFTMAIDDSDSGSGGCTTHLLGLIMHELRSKVELADYPLLVRLAPGVPWKTRGNAAVALRGRAVRSTPEDIAREAWEIARQYSEGRPPEPGKGPGLALYPGVNAWQDPLLRAFYLEAVRGLVSSRAAETVARRVGAQLYGGRGIVGALAAIAALAPGDPYTYELVAYRSPENWTRPRCVRDEPGIEASIPACAFNNIDIRTGRTVAAPRGPDPVLAGFRGTCPGALGCYKQLLCEEPDFWVLYRSNQHTSTHASRGLRLRPYDSGTALVRILEARTAPGGHVIARGVIGGRTVWAAAYRETGPVRRAILEAAGSSVLVEGTLHPRVQGLTLGVEAVRWAEAPLARLELAPRCPKCGARMKSMGKGKGYRCPRCEYRDPSAEKLAIVLAPRISSAPVTPPPGSVPHLVRPHYVYRLPREPPPPPSWPDILSTGPDPPRGTTSLCGES